MYSNFRGVDFSSDPSIVNLSRSPDALNVWKNYSDTQGSCIETRPGIKLLGDFEGRINGIYIYKDKALVHVNKNLYLWTNFPDTPAEKTLLKENMQNNRSSFCIFNDELFIVDGENYLVYSNGELKNVSDNAYIPTTTTGRSPSGGGDKYQDVNVLQTKRKNGFVADGTSKDYFLDATNIDSIEEVIVNDSVVTNYTVDKTLGKVSFTTAPTAPNISGIDNVYITYSKATVGYTDRIGKCKVIVIYDNRLFFTGNLEYPNAIFHCALNNPYYVSDLAYYEDGTSESAIKSLVVGNGILWVFKEASQQNDTIFYHNSTLDTEGKVYPNYQGNVSVGCYSEAINYKDDIVFLSRTGLEGISNNDITSKQLLSHRSSLVDNKLTNENNFSMSMMVEWQGYLIVLVNGSIYLADYRQMYQGALGYEYEWYLWQFNKNICFVKSYKEKLYLGSENGQIYVLEGTNDNGEIINSYWTTPMDNFGYGNLNKTTNKRGGIAKIKTIPNGIIKVAECTNKRSENKFISMYSATGFDFQNIDFQNFAFTTKNNSYILYKIKEKKFLEVSLKFYSDEIDKPFGLYNAILEAFVGGYTKK